MLSDSIPGIHFVLEFFNVSVLQTVTITVQLKSLYLYL